jgi:hypothetical protein
MIRQLGCGKPRACHERPYRARLQMSWAGARKAWASLNLLFSIFSFIFIVDQIQF